MREIKTSYAKSLYVGALPHGCVQCIKGQKLVLFVTGICPHSCYYCPLSLKRKNVDKTWANEALVLKDDDVVREARLCSAKGAGITGGDPLARFERTIGYIRLLKKVFGRRFHIHLYTSGDLLSDERLKELAAAGLDEIRLHLRKDYGLIDKCLGYKFDAGVEVPVVPGKEKELQEMILYLEKAGVKFLNLNELEMSELTFDEMTDLGHESNEDIFNTVNGSRELGVRLLEFAARNTENLSVHLCTSSVKNIYQYENRLKMRAKNILKGFERIVDHCLIEKGIVEADDIDAARKDLAARLRLKDSEIYVDKEKKRVDVSVKNARLARKLGYKCAIVKVFPTSDSFDVEKDPL
ncbi:MAG: radical SAM protein [archaeon]